MSAQHARYRIADLTLPGLPVWLTVCGQEMRGLLRLTPSGKRIFRVYTDGRHTIDLPKHAYPDLWRPIGAWPEALPAAAVLTADVDWHSALPPTRTPEPPEPTHGWPYPDIRLGSAGAPPSCTRECEARILRALRTFEVFNPADTLEWHECAWPKDLMISARVVDREVQSAARRAKLKGARTFSVPGLRSDDYAYFHLDHTRATDARPLPARWLPSPRDVSDYEWKGGPLRWASDGVALFELRAAMPQFAFWQIAEALGRDEASIRLLYQEGCELAFERATHG